MAILIKKMSFYKNKMAFLIKKMAFLIKKMAFLVVLFDFYSRYFIEACLIVFNYFLRTNASK